MSGLHIGMTVRDAIAHVVFLGQTNRQLYQRREKDKSYHILRASDTVHKVLDC
jgi:hypothetical protein